MCASVPAVNAVAGLYSCKWRGFRLAKALDITISEYKRMHVLDVSTPSCCTTRPRVHFVMITIVHSHCNEHLNTLFEFALSRNCRKIRSYQEWFSERLVWVTMQAESLTTFLTCFFCQLLSRHCDRSSTTLDYVNVGLTGGRIYLHVRTDPEALAVWHDRAPARDASSQYDVWKDPRVHPCTGAIASNVRTF